MDLSPRVLSCPQCGAALAPPSRFAREARCAFCGSSVQLDPSVVSVARFREAHARWSSPATHGYTRWLTVAGTPWAPVRALGRGALADVFLAARARPPTALAVVAVLREGGDLGRFHAKARTLSRLAGAAGAGDGRFAAQLPTLVEQAVVGEGPGAGRAAMVLRWSPGFEHPLDQVRRAYPGGVSPEIATWMWRRTLELLSHLHRQDVVHGALFPPHLLAHGSEHGLRLVGFGSAGRGGEPLAPPPAEWARFAPPEATTLQPALDVALSARVIAWTLGGDEATGETPPRVPRPLAALLEAAARLGARTDAWALREEVGRVAGALFGPPSFHPLSLLPASPARP